MSTSNIRHNTLIQLNKLKDEFAIEVKYHDLEKLDQITKQIFSLMRNYLNVYPNDEKIRATIYATEKTYKEVDLRGFIKQINILTNLLQMEYKYTVEKEVGQFTQKNPKLEDEINEWVEKEKELKKQDPEQVSRIEKNLSRIAEIIKGE